MCTWLIDVYGRSRSILNFLTNVPKHLTRVFFQMHKSSIFALKNATGASGHDRRVGLIFITQFKKNL